jgi:hypothetical protein
VKTPFFKQTNSYIITPLSKLFYITFLLLAPFLSLAQEEEATVYQGKKYIDIRLRAVEKFNKKVEQQQKKLLARLEKKEKKFIKNLKKKDSAAHARIAQDQRSFKSIRKKAKPDSSALYGSTAKKANGTMDSLKKVKNFIQDKKKKLEENAHVVGEGKGGASPSDDYEAKIAEQKAKLNYRKYIGEQINQRTALIKQIKSSLKGKVKGFAGIDKHVFYSNAKVASYKKIMDDPSLAEDKAFEFLQGQEGFDKYLQDGDGSALNGMSGSQLEKMGYQTKQQLTANLNKKFGGSLGGIQQSVSKQVQQFNDKTKKLSDAKNKVNKAKQAKNSAKHAKQSAKNLKSSARIDKPTFKVNPMRGKPLSQRIEKQINWQTTRATIDGKPAVFQFSLMAGFRQTQKLTYGIGVAPAIGLGNGWNDIHFTFQGIGFRTYITWQWQYGIGAYAGYERLYNRAAFLDTKEISKLPPKPHNQKEFSESMLIGLTKQYHVSDKWSGGIQVLYDIWWKDKGLRSPIQLRFTTSKN